MNQILLTDVEMVELKKMLEEKMVSISKDLKALYRIMGIIEYNEEFGVVKVDSSRYTNSIDNNHKEYSVCFGMYAKLVDEDQLAPYILTEEGYKCQEL